MHTVPAGPPPNTRALSLPPPPKPRPQTQQRQQHPDCHHNILDPSITMASEQTLASAAARLRDASKHRAKMLKDQGLEVWDQARTKAPTYWREYKPRTLLQWTAFAGLVLLAISALSTVLNILGGITLGMAWIGLVVYFVTVSSSTVAGFFCGSAMMMFSATTAIMGSSILAGVASVHAMLAVYARAKGYASPYLDAIQERRSQQQLPPTAQMRYAPQGSPTRLPASVAADAPASKLLADVNPGKPQAVEHAGLTAAPASSYSSDAVPKGQAVNKTSNVSKGGSTAQYSGSMSSNGVSHRAAAVSTA